MKQEQQGYYTTNEVAYQVVMPLDLGIKIPEDDSLRTLMRIAERIEWSELSGAYERKNRRGDATAKQMFLLVVLAFMNGIYSTRKIEKACRTDIRFIWLLAGKRVPDHTRIARFVTLMKEGIMEGLFYQLVHLLKEDGEIEYAHLFVDGTKVEANANRYTFVWRKRVERGMEKLTQKREALVLQLRTQYALDLGVIKDAEGILAWLHWKARVEGIGFVHGKGKRKHELQKQIEQLEAMLKKEAEYRKSIQILGKRNSYSKTDKDATFMRMKDDHMKNGQLKPGYNLQLGIEAEYIVGVDVSSDLNDTHALPLLLERMEEKGRIKHQDITTDAGYESEETYAKVKARGQVAYIKPLNYEKSKKRSFRKNAFLRENMPYDAERDCFICPAKQELTFQGTRTRYSKSGYVQEVSVYKAKSCVDCPHKGKCTKAKEARTIEISWAFEQARAESRERITSELGILLRVNRSIQSEGAFGVLKEDRHFRRLKRRDMDRVFNEILLYAFAFNVQKLHDKTQQNRLKTMLIIPKAADTA